MMTFSQYKPSKFLSTERKTYAVGYRRIGLKIWMPYIAMLIGNLTLEWLQYTYILLSFVKGVITLELQTYITW